MNKKTRFIILACCVVVFLIITPYIVLYSLGYRVDVKHFTTVATGGIYIKALPQELNMIIDSTITDKTGIFSNTVFEQNLLPGSHTIAISKPGYWDYQKSLPVVENEVTKLEHVVLIKKNIAFSLLSNNTDAFSIAPDGKQALLAIVKNGVINFLAANVVSGQIQDIGISKKGQAVTDTLWSQDSSKVLFSIDGNYFLLEPFLATPKITSLPLLSGSSMPMFNPQDSSQIFFLKNKNLYSNQEPAPVIKSVTAYTLGNNIITWLSYDGFLYQAGIDGREAQKTSLTIFPINKTASYALQSVDGNIFLKENAVLWLFNKTTKTFESFYQDVVEISLSGDGQKILFCNAGEVFYTYPQGNRENPLRQPNEKIFLAKNVGAVHHCSWLNNDYIIFGSGDNIMISEIDARGNINTIMLPDTLALSSGINIEPKNPILFFNQQDKKLYVLTDGNLVSSERLP